MVAQLKVNVEVNPVAIINRHSFKMGRFKELIRFTPNISVFKKWQQTVRVHDTKPFATGFVRYQFE